MQPGSYAIERIRMLKDSINNISSASQAFAPALQNSSTMANSLATRNLQRDIADKQNRKDYFNTAMNSYQQKLDRKAQDQRTADTLQSQKDISNDKIEAEKQIAEDRRKFEESMDDKQWGRRNESGRPGQYGAYSIYEQYGGGRSNNEEDPLTPNDFWYGRDDKNIMGVYDVLNGSQKWNNFYSPLISTNPDNPEEQRKKIIEYLKKKYAYVGGAKKDYNYDIHTLPQLRGFMAKEAATDPEIISLIEGHLEGYGLNDAFYDTTRDHIINTMLPKFFAGEDPEEIIFVNAPIDKVDEPSVRTDDKPRVGMKNYQGSRDGVTVIEKEEVPYEKPDFQEYLGMVRYLFGNDLKIDENEIEEYGIRDNLKQFERATDFNNMRANMNNPKTLEMIEELYNAVKNSRNQPATNTMQRPGKSGALM